MQRLLWRLVLTVAVLLLVIPTFAQSGNESGWLRFVHVVPGASSIDIYTDGELTVTNLSFGESSNYVIVDGGTHTITITLNSVTTNLWEQQISVAPGAALTLVASSTDPLGFQAYQDDLAPLTLGNTRLTAIHAIAGAPTVDVVLADGRAVMPGLQYSQPYGTLDLASQVYDIAVVPEGETIENAVIPSTSLPLNSGTSYMAVAFGTANAGNFLLLSAPTLPDAEGSSVRFVHGIPGAAAVDLYVNDVLVAPLLSFDGPASDFIALPEGEHTVALRFGGETDDLISDSVEVATGDTFTLIVSETEDGIGLQRFDDPVSGISKEEAILSVINTLPAESAVNASIGSAEVLGDVEAGESDSAILEPGEETLAAAITSEGDSSSFDLLDTIYGGIYYTILAVEGADGAEAVLLNPVSLAQGAASAPGDQTLSVETVVEATQPVEVAAQPTIAPTVPAPAATEEAGTTATPQSSDPLPTAVAPTTNLPTAVILLDQGANLHVRQYPSSTAFSLGLAPAGTILEVIGRKGAPELGPEETPDPEATPYVDPAWLLTSDDQDLNPAETWLFVTYRPVEGGEIDGWVNALYLDVSDNRGRQQRIALLPTIPENRAGEARQTAGQTSPSATPIALDAVLATVLLDPGANLHLRRNPNPSAESLALIPSNAQVTVTGRTESGDWLQVTYEGQQGWIASQYVTLTFNGAPYQNSELTVISSPTPTSSPTTTSPGNASG